MVASLRNSIAQHLWQSLLSISLLIVIIASLTDSLDGALWLNDTARLVAIAWLGLGYGALLSVAHFRSRTTALLTGVMSLAITVLAIGRVVPSPLTLATWPLSDSIWLAHVRLLLVYDQLNAAVQATLHGNFDKTLFAFLVGWLGWISSVGLIWSVLRRRQALPGIVLCALTLAINISLNGKDTSFPLLFIAGAVILLASTAFTHHLHDWQTRRVDYPELIAEDWIIGAVLISAFVISLVWVSAPESRHSLDDFFTALRRPSQAGPAQALPNRPQPFAPAFNAEVPDLGLVGAPIPNSEDTVMWVKVSDPPPLVQERGGPVSLAPQHYWRGGIFTKYNGTGWELEPSAEVTATVPFPPEVPAGHYALAQTFEIVAQHGDSLFAVNMPIQAGTGTSLHFFPPDNNALLQGKVSNYEVTSWATKATAGQLRADTTDYPPEITALYLQLPDSLPLRVRNLAARLAAEAVTPYEKALRIQNYLRVTYAYRLDVPPPPPHADAVDYFLFEAPGGFCSYYASAMAVMLRTQGVPARVVTGFATGEYDRSRNAYRVPASAAHAWVEVYFPHYGWIEFEPTASQTTFNYIDDQASAAPTAAPATGPLDISAGLEWIVGVALVIGLAVLAQRKPTPYLRRERELQGRGPDRQSRTLYWQMRRSLAQVGLSAPPHVTPDEFLSAQVDRLTDQPPLQLALQQATALYIRAAYTTRLPAAGDVLAARRAWRQARPAWLRLWLRAQAARLPRRK